MIKRYSFINEAINPLAVTAGVAGGAALIGGGAAVLPAVAAAGLGMGAINTIKNSKQNRFNNKYMNLMYKELAACRDRNQALSIVNRYSTQLTSMYSKMDKKVVNKVSAMQNFINTNFRIPLIKIINNQQDPNWKQNALTYFKKNKNKINFKNALQTGVSTASLALSGTGLATGASAVHYASQALFYAKSAINQLKSFNSARYFTNLEKELAACPDDNKQMAAQIIQKYCFDISNNIQTIVNKSQKKINYNVQQQMRTRFLVPCMQIINQNNRYWKMSLIDYIKAEKLQGVIQSICDSITQLLIPNVMRRARQ